MVRVILLLISTIVFTDAAPVHHYEPDHQAYIIRPAPRSRTYGWWGIGHADQAPVRIPRLPVVTKWLPGHALEYRASWVPSIPKVLAPNRVKEAVKGHAIPRIPHGHRPAPVAHSAHETDSGVPANLPVDVVPETAIRALPPPVEEEEFSAPVADSSPMNTNKFKPVEANSIIIIDSSATASNTASLSSVNEVVPATGKDLASTANTLPAVNDVVPVGDGFQADDLVVALDEAPLLMREVVPVADTLPIVEQVTPLADVVIPNTEEALFITEKVVPFGRVLPADEVVVSDNVLSASDNAASVADPSDMVEVDRPAEEEVIFLLEQEEKHSNPQAVIESRSFYSARDKDDNLLDTSASYSFAPPSAWYLAPPDAERREARALSTPAEFHEKPIPVPVPIPLEPLSMALPGSRALTPWMNLSSRSARARIFNVLPSYRSHPRPWMSGRERRGRQLLFG